MNLSGIEKDIVLSSRVRLARNIDGYVFSPSMSKNQKSELNSAVISEIESNPFFKDFEIYDINDLDELDRVVLKEKKIISERYYRKGDGFVVTDSSGCFSIVTDDVDHLRISSVYDGLNIDAALDSSMEIAAELSRRFSFSVDGDNGFLTVNIPDSGIAMKGSLFLHLPVLSASELVDHYIINTIETKLEVTGFSGGGDHSLGGLYIISNKTGFFPDEIYLADLMNKTAMIFIEAECKAREELIGGDFPGLEDRIFRSYGILGHCRQISEMEAVSALSMVRLGVSVGWISDLNLKDISIATKRIGSGFLRSCSYMSNPDESDVMRLRAETIRETIGLNI